MNLIGLYFFLMPQLDLTSLFLIALELSTLWACICFLFHFKWIAPCKNVAHSAFKQRFINPGKEKEIVAPVSLSSSFWINKILFVLLCLFSLDLQ